MSALAPRPHEERAPAVVRFWDDLHRGRFESGVARLLPVVPAVVVAAVAVLAGAVPALVATVVLAAAYVALLVAVDRVRWRAQDTVYRYQALRDRRWIAETGASSPVGDPTRAETWLATHPAGSVPQVYRAVVAWNGTDPTLAARERALLPAETAVDRARAAWLDVAAGIDAGSEPGLGTLAALVAEVPPGLERTEMDAFLAQAHAIGRHAHGDAGWREPLVEAAAAAPATTLPWRTAVRLWFVRLRTVVLFLVLALILGTSAPAVFSESIPAEWAQTVLSTRGDHPSFDEEAVARSLLGLAKALPAAVRADPDPLDDAAWSRLVDAGLPTLIWEVGMIDVAGPADAPGRLWQVEVLAGSGDDDVLLTFDGADGPVYRYRVDPAVTAGVRAALGLPPSG